MKMIGLARLGRDAEVRHTPSGQAVANLSLAVNYGRADGDNGRPTQWIDAALWGDRAEKLAPYLKKGSQHCFTLSDAHLETYQGKNGEGVKMVATVLDVELGPRAEGAAPAQEQRPAAQPPRQAAPQRQAPPPQDFDDSIPF